VTAPFDFRGQVVLVTGASRGIGRAIAIGFAEAGADVVVTSRDARALDEVVAAIRERGREALALAADLSTSEGAERVATSALAWKGAIDVLVNNAGTSEPKPFVDSDDALFDRVFALNVSAVVRVTRAIGPSMLARKKGSVIFVGSVLGRTAIPGNASYYASKGAVEALARGLAVEWARTGVRVNTLAPGFVDTDLVAEVREPGGLGDYAKRRTPMRRVARPEEMISAALYLGSDASSFVTGSTVHVDGGWMSA
jgi:NAD(P)-dependent dehydrogenase (short-subunit alcohol dehydrogenase family)